MLKKFFAATLLLMTVCANCAAMNFSEPVAVGTVSVAGGEGALEIFGATEIDATTDNRGNYVAGTATFGGLYLHFDGVALAEKSRVATTSADMLKIYDEVSFFGGRDVKNSVPYFVFEGATKIYRLGNDAGLELYLLATETGGGGSVSVVGLRGGKWVRYFNTRDARKVYGIAPNFHMTDFSAAGDEIIFAYRMEQTNIRRELRYRWDAAAQWFAVAQS